MKQKVSIIPLHSQGQWSHEQNMCSLHNWTTGQILKLFVHMSTGRTQYADQRSQPSHSKVKVLSKGQNLHKQNLYPHNSTSPPGLILFDLILYIPVYTFSVISEQVFLA